MEEEKEISGIRVYDCVVTKNPMFCLQEAIRGILMCLGFVSSKPDDSSSSSSSSSRMPDKEEDGREGKQQGSDSASINNNNKKDDTPAETNLPPQSQTQIEAATRRGRAAPRPGVSRGPPPQNN